MRIDLYVYDSDGRLKPIDIDCPLETVPRIGETVSIGTRQARAKVQEIEYLIPTQGEEVLVGVILDRTPGGAGS